jgi:hypothetical protein
MSKSYIYFAKYNFKIFQIFQKYIFGREIHGDVTLISATPCMNN